MRIAILTIFFASLIYYFSPREVKKTTHTDSIDIVKIKMGAPDRSERLLTVETPKETVAEKPADVPEVVSESAEQDDLEHFEEVPWTEAEKGWHSELKESLVRMEPEDGETIFNSYLSEKESYQSEMDSLLSEKQNIANLESATEIEHLIVQLDQKHEAKLKEIFGAHYDNLKDQHSSYLENSSTSSDQE